MPDFLSISEYLHRFGNPFSAQTSHPFSIKPATNFHWQQPFLLIMEKPGMPKVLGSLQWARCNNQMTQTCKYVAAHANYRLFWYAKEWLLLDEKKVAGSIKILN